MAVDNIVDEKVQTEDDLLKLMDEEPEEKKEEDDEIKEEKEDDKEDDKSESDKDNENEEPEEEKLDDEELALEDDKLEDLVDVPVRKKEILAKYPNLEKDFPSLFKGYYREKQYADVFPTLEDAKIAQEKVNLLKGFEEKIFSGDISTVLSAVKEHEPEAYSKVVDNYLQVLHDTDEKAYIHIVNRTLGDVLNNVYRLGSSKNNEELKEAAKMVYETIFGSTSIEPPRTYGNKKEVNPEVEKLKKEKEESENRYATTTWTELDTKVKNQLINTVTNNIDPKEQMTPYVRKKAIDDAVNKLQDAMKEDKRFTAIIDTLKKKAAESKYSSESVLRVRNATLSKARSLLRDTILSVRNEALKGSRENKRVDNDEKTKRLPPGKSTAQGKTSGKSKEYKGGDVLSFLNQD